ncbi:Protein of unassigned function [Burkholderia sp. IT-111MI5]
MTHSNDRLPLPVQSPAEAARLHARRRYAVRAGHAPGGRPLLRRRPVARCARNVLHPHVTKRTVA